MIAVDLNCDLGEGAGYDAELMPLVSSANVACGAHAGSEAVMRATVALAQTHGVAVGAHPGYADRAHFGRRPLALARQEVIDLVRKQVEALVELGRVRHVKPHGALYNQAAADRDLASAIAAAVYAADPRLILFAPAGSELVRAGRDCGLRVAEEVFADRRYRADGSLVPRNEPGAVITDEAAMLAQVLAMVRGGRVTAVDGSDVPVRPDTVCLHGDGAHAVAFARRIRDALQRAGIAVRAPEGS